MLQVAPLLGLLGTVLGMIDLFTGFQQGGNSNINLTELSAGIWKALITTAAGLTIAVPTLAAHSYLSSRVDNVRFELSDLIQRILYAIPGHKRSRKLKAMMEIKTRKRATPNISLAALVDVVFILVIFIVLGANFHRIQTLDVSIPVAESLGQADTRSLVITIPESGQLDILGEKIDPDNLKSELRAKVADFESVLLVADQSTPVQRVIRILSDAQMAGFVSVSIATQEPE